MSDDESVMEKTKVPKEGLSVAQEGWFEILSRVAKENSY